MALCELKATTPANTCCLTFPHPRMQDVLLAHAEGLGVDVRRGVAAATMTLGEAPRVHIGSAAPSARLVVLADGLESRLRSALGLEVQRDPEQLVMAGMILE